MPDYRIFTNDRPNKKGVRMYSCLTSVKAATAAHALERCRLEPPSAVAIRWPKASQTEKEKEWLIKHT